MRIFFLTCYLLCALAVPVSAQTVVQSMLTTNNDNKLAMTIVGKKDGRLFRHNLHFDAVGTTQTQVIRSIGRRYGHLTCLASEMFRE